MATNAINTTNLRMVIERGYVWASPRSLADDGEDANTAVTPHRRTGGRTWAIEAIVLPVWKAVEAERPYPA